MRIGRGMQLDSDDIQKYLYKANTCMVTHYAPFERLWAIAEFNDKDNTSYGI